MMFNRANDLLGANWTLHDLRHTATFLMLDDPNMPPVYVQKILGRKYLSTLDIYKRPNRGDVIRAGLAHHARQEKPAQLDAQISRKQESVDLGIPTFREIVARTTAAATPPEPA
ncbi:site-specific integrase [Streptomyces vilmorinianum]|uniref:site-specific integrase n=1 Tax=Streptomyces vilmorinianum TaxID=3051092 RepID=UPI0010FB7D72|nr:site-specific integrase [Streptomyces vilmorinianum]